LEPVIENKELENFDKIFASTWIDENTVCFGTKVSPNLQLNFLRTLKYNPTVCLHLVNQMGFDNKQEYLYPTDEKVRQ
jgi:hypothetical protein